MIFLILFNDLDLQIIKLNGFYKIILIKSCFAVAFEFSYGLIQPDGLAQVKLIANFVKGPENLVGTGVIAVVGNAGVLQHMVILKSSCP